MERQIDVKNTLVKYQQILLPFIVDSALQKLFVNAISPHDLNEIWQRV